MTKCSELKNCRSWKDRETVVKKANRCFKCLGKYTDGGPHVCRRNINGKFFCKKHNKNVLICGCNTTKKDGVKQASTTNNAVNFKMNDLKEAMTNTALVYEVVLFVDHQGKEHRVLLTYDSGNSNMCVDYKKINSI